MRSAIVVGNPKPRSRTLEAAHTVAERITGTAPAVRFDLVERGAALLDWSEPGMVADMVAQMHSCDLVIVASPTYKATITGLLKLFLDRVEGGALRGLTAVPLMLGGDLRHSLAPDVFLRPILLELGASCPTAGLFLLESDYVHAERLDRWLVAAVPEIKASVRARGRGPTA